VAGSWIAFAGAYVGDVLAGVCGRPLGLTAEGIVVEENLLQTRVVDETFN